MGYEEGMDALPQQTEAAPAAKLSTGTAPAVEKDDALQKQWSGVTRANTRFGRCTALHTSEPYQWCALEENVTLLSIGPQ